MPQELDKTDGELNQGFALFRSVWSLSTYKYTKVETTHHLYISRPIKIIQETVES